MIISTIVACAKNNVIGKDNQIPWYLPADLQYFKRTTLGRHVLMGRNCYDSIGKPLPKRTNIIITRNPFFIVSNCLVAHSIEEALQMAKTNGETEVFIIGGGEIYRQSQHLWDRIYLTEVDLECDGDVLFPDIDCSKWKETQREQHEADEKNEFAYSFVVLEKV